VVLKADETSFLFPPVREFFISGWTPDSTRVVCYRDLKFMLLSLDSKESGAGKISYNSQLFFPSEWVAYSSALSKVVWNHQVDKTHWAIVSSDGVVVQENVPNAERVVPSPDGRFLALFGGPFQHDLWVYDNQTAAWTDLGPLRIHPDKDWGYIQPDWNPWFADSSRLVFVSGSAIIVSTPDGKQKIAIQSEGAVGIPTASPDGHLIAFVTFEPSPRKVRPDFQFWGNTTIWTVKTEAGAAPHAVTEKNPDEVYDLKWLGNDALVFDRIADEVFYKHARIWKLTLAH
jgi:hypothetical protein